jgi:guanyl-specific ribonuclease Sa
MQRWLMTSVGLFLAASLARAELPTRPVASAVGDGLTAARTLSIVWPGSAPMTLPRGVPEKALKVLKYVDEHDDALPGYEGGRTFLNLERHLPQFDRRGRRIRYREWDVNPHRPGINRGAERLITGSNGSAYYTSDHYRTFKRIR